MWFLLVYSNFISLKSYDFVPVISIAYAIVGTMFSLVGGKIVEEGSVVINAKLFW